MPVCAVGRVTAAFIKVFALPAAACSAGGGGTEAGPPPSALSVWPLQNLTPFRPGFHTEGKEDEEAALLAPLGTLGTGRMLASYFWPLKALSSLLVNTWAWNLQLRAPVSRLLPHRSALWASLIPAWHWACAHLFPPTWPGHCPQIKELVPAVLGVCVLPCCGLDGGMPLSLP